MYTYSMDARNILDELSQKLTLYRKNIEGQQAILGEILHNVRSAQAYDAPSPEMDKLAEYFDVPFMLLHEPLGRHLMGLEHLRDEMLASTALVAATRVFAEQENGRWPSLTRMALLCRQEENQPAYVVLEKSEDNPYLDQWLENIAGPPAQMFPDLVTSLEFRAKDLLRRSHEILDIAMPYPSA